MCWCHVGVRHPPKTLIRVRHQTQLKSETIQHRHQKHNINTDKTTSVIISKNDQIRRHRHQYRNTFFQTHRCYREHNYLVEKQPLIILITQEHDLNSDNNNPRSTTLIYESPYSFISLSFLSNPHKSQAYDSTMMHALHDHIT